MYVRYYLAHVGSTPDSAVDIAPVVVAHARPCRTGQHWLSVLALQPISHGFLILRFHPRPPRECLHPGGWYANDAVSMPRRPCVGGRDCSGEVTLGKREV
jgi:hypothetical protein